MDSVEVDRLVLLGKAEAAYRAREDAKAVRILQRVLAQTSAKHSAHTLPIVVAPTPPEDKPRQQLEEPPTDGTLPLLAPALHSALGAAAASAAGAAGAAVTLPTATEPPLFLLYNNIGLVHLRARKMRLAQVYMTRALEAAQALTSSIAPASQSTSSASTSASSSTSTKFLFTPPSAAAQPRARPLSPRSPSTPTVGGPSAPPPHLTTFLLTKQRQVFANTGLVLLRAHQATMETTTTMMSGSKSEDEDVERGLQLAARCFRHALHLQPATATTPTSGVEQPPSASASTPLLHLRLAESRIALYQRDQGRHRATSHPLVYAPLARTPAAETTTPTAAATAAATGSGVGEDLEEAILHLRAALTELQRDAFNTPTQQQQPPPSLHPQLQLACIVKLAYALGESQRPHEVLTALDGLLPALLNGGDLTAAPAAAAGSSSSPLSAALAASPLLLLQAEFYAASALVALQREEEALKIVAQSTVPTMVEARRLAGTAAATSNSGAPVVVPSSDAYVLRVLSLLVYIALAQRRDADARRMVEVGLRIAPRDTSLLQILLALESRQRQVEPVWLLKTGQQPTSILG